MSFQVTAILAAYNEEDIIGAVLSHLVAQGVLVYFIDHESNDATLDEVRRFEGRGVIGVEHLPAGKTVRWADVLRRKEVLARKLPGDWFIHHDADEFRESPWSDVNLLDGIRRVDALGYSAIDFELLQFRPTHDAFKKGDDPLVAFPFCEPGLEYDRLQIKCWKRNGEVTIADSGGHDARFPGRRVFPIRFLLRHYPFRTQAQGTRKVVRDRLLRFDAQEHAQGWHLQYAGAREGQSFLRDPAGLTRFDAETARTRLCIEHRGVEDLRAQLEGALAEAAIRQSDLDWYRREWPLREAELNTAQGELYATHARLDTALVELSTTHAKLNTALVELNATRADLNTALVELNATHAKLNTALVGLNATRADLNAAYEEVERLQAVRSELLESRAGAVRLQDALRFVETELESLRIDSVHLVAAAEARQAHIEEMLASWSWRSTAGARAALKRLRGH